MSGGFHDHFTINNYVASLLPDMIRECHMVRSWPYAFNNPIVMCVTAHAKGNVIAY